MSESTGNASATFENAADFQYVKSNASSFEQAVDGRIVATEEEKTSITFSFRVQVAAALAGGALMLAINRFFPSSRYEAMKTANMEGGAHPFDLHVLSVEDVNSKVMLHRAMMAASVDAAATQYNINFRFRDPADQKAFFVEEGLRLCLAREVNNDANTCWLALDSNRFNAGQSAVGWNVAFVASQISQSVVENGGVITPPSSHSESFSMGQSVTLDDLGYWQGPAEAPAGLLRVLNQRTANVYVGLSQQASGDPQPKPIYAAPRPVAAQPTDFTVAQSLYVWGSATVKQGEVTATTYTTKQRFPVSTTSTPTVTIYKNAANEWVFTSASA